MDPIAHVTFGLHIANLGFDQRYGRRATLILAAASLFPDLDSVSWLISREAYDHFHRGFTHALSGSVLCSAVLALCTAHRDLTRWFSMDWALWTLGMMGHTATDLITRGIPVLYPLSQVPWSLALVSWGDGFLTGLWLGLAVAAVWFARYRRAISAAALGTGVVYLAYHSVVPASGPSWLSMLWYALWMR